MSIDFDSFEANISAVLNGTALDETEKENLAAVLLEAANSGDPPIDRLGRYTLALDTVRWLLYAGKITHAKCGELISLLGEMIDADGTLLTLSEETDENEED